MAGYPERIKQRQVKIGAALLALVIALALVIPMSAVLDGVFPVHPFGSAEGESYIDPGNSNVAWIYNNRLYVFYGQGANGEYHFYSSIEAMKNNTPLEYFVASSDSQGTPDDIWWEYHNRWANQGSAAAAIDAQIAEINTLIAANSRKIDYYTFHRNQAIQIINNYMGTGLDEEHAGYMGYKYIHDTTPAYTWPDQSSRAVWTDKYDSAISGDFNLTTIRNYCNVKVTIYTDQNNTYTSQINALEASKTNLAVYKFNWWDWTYVDNCWLENGANYSISKYPSYGGSDVSAPFTIPIDHICSHTHTLSKSNPSISDLYQLVQLYNKDYHDGYYNFENGSENITGYYKTVDSAAITGSYFSPVDYSENISANNYIKNVTVYIVDTYNADNASYDFNFFNGRGEAWVKYEPYASDAIGSAFDSGDLTVKRYTSSDSDYSLGTAPMITMSGESRYFMHYEGVTIDNNTVSDDACAVRISNGTLYQLNGGTITNSKAGFGNGGIGIGVVVDDDGGSTQKGYFELFFGEKSLGGAKIEKCHVGVDAIHGEARLKTDYYKIPVTTSEVTVEGGILYGKRTSVVSSNSHYLLDNDYDIRLTHRDSGKGGVVVKTTDRQYDGSVNGVPRLEELVSVVLKPNSSDWQSGDVILRPISAKNYPTSQLIPAEKNSLYVTGVPDGLAVVYDGTQTEHVVKLAESGVYNPRLNVYYKTLGLAVNAAADGDTLIFFTDTSETGTVNINKNLTVRISDSDETDIFGNTVGGCTAKLAGDGITVASGKTLTIGGSSNTLGKLVFEGKITNNGTLTLSEDFALESETVTAVLNNGTLTLGTGTTISNDAENGIGIDNNGTLVMNGIMSIAADNEIYLRENRFITKGWGSGTMRNSASSSAFRFTIEESDPGNDRKVIDSGTGSGNNAAYYETTGMFEIDGYYLEYVDYNNSRQTAPYIRIASSQLFYYTLCSEPNVINSVEMPVNSSYDLTQHVPGDKLFAGYRVYNSSGVLSDSLEKTICAENLGPVAGTRYYIEFVSGDYLAPKHIVVYPTTTAPFTVKSIYMLTAVNDLEYYRSWGFVTKTDSGDTVNTEIKNSTDVYDAVRTKSAAGVVSLMRLHDIFPSLTEGYLGIIKLCDLPQSGTDYTFNAYWVTQDGTVVYGKKQRNFVIQPTYDRESILTGSSGQKFGNGDTVIVNPDRTPFSHESDDVLPQSVRDIYASDFLTAHEYYGAYRGSEQDPFIIKKHSGGQVFEQNAVVGNNSGRVTYDEKYGYMFAGWYSDAGLTCAADFSDIGDDLDVYAKYVPVDGISFSTSKKADGVVSSVTMTEEISGSYVRCGVIAEHGGVRTDCPLSYSGSTNRLLQIIYKLFGRIIGGRAYSADYDCSNLRNGDHVSFTLYWITEDGTTVYGETENYVCYFGTLWKI